MDLLRWPIIGPFLRWRHARTSLQLVFILLAVVVVIHGLTGPDLASNNLATVLTWVHYRGLLVVTLLAAGNFFCAGCPFVRVRDWGRRLRAPGLSWPARLRGKWMALILLATVLFTYELFDLWALPRATAWLVLAYFAAALVVDMLFRGATFCKHLCPIGQFNFVASMVSPLEVRVREKSTCDSCRTADCVAGRRPVPASPVVTQRGCELGLFLPAKVGNLDCTFCLDCVQACPHDNVALAVRVPALELLDDSRRSAIGRLTDRTDILALVVLFVFGGLLNAFAMTSPALALMAWVSSVLGGAGDLAALGLLFVTGLLVVSGALFALAADVSRRLARVDVTRVSISRHFVVALVPFGLGVWLAHYGFHLLVGVLVIVPVTQSAVVGWLGAPLLGAPLWTWAGLRPGAVLPWQVGFLALGACGSVATLMAIAERAFAARPVRVAAPWIALVVLLFAAAVWVMLQPMEMRGTGL